MLGAALYFSLLNLELQREEGLRLLGATVTILGAILNNTFTQHILFYTFWARVSDLQDGAAAGEAA